MSGSSVSRDLYIYMYIYIFFSTQMDFFGCHCASSTKKEKENWNYWLPLRTLYFLCLITDFCKCFFFFLENGGGGRGGRGGSGRYSRWVLERVGRVTVNLKLIQPLSRHFFPASVTIHDWNSEVSSINENSKLSFIIVINLDMMHRLC